jgi:hypothetical protein
MPSSAIPSDFTYVLATDTGKVRFELGDTLLAEAKMTDTEIEYALSIEGSVIRAAARCAESLAARYAGKDSSRVVQAQWSQANLFKKYSELAIRLRKRCTGRGSFIMPSISRAEKDENHSDTDIVQPRFYRDQFTNLDSTSEDSENS